MINSRGGGSNNPNSSQQIQHQQRQNLNHFQGQGQSQQQRHHNPQQQQQSFNRNSSNANAIPGQNRSQRPQIPPNHHHSNNSGQPVRTSSSSQNQQHNNSGQTNHTRPHSGMNNQNMMKQNSQSNNNNNNSSAQAVNNGPPLPIVLPKGWKREEIIRTKGLSAGLVDVVYVPQPNSDLCNSEIVGKKFRNKIELRKHFGTKYDTSLLDFKTGKVSQLAWRRQRRMKSLANTNNYASAAKYDTYLNVPVRQNTSVLKSGVFCITNNHKNEPTPASVLNTATPAIGPNGQPMNNRINEKPKPIQLFWELRFNDMKSIDSDLIDLENINDDFELENIPKFKNFPTSNETVLRSVAASWYLNQNKNLIGQEKEFTKNARIFIDREQPLIPQISIKEDEIKQQEIKVKEMRKKLQLALDDLENLDRINKTDFKLVDEMENENDHHDGVDEQHQDEIETKNVALIDQ